MTNPVKEKTKNPGEEGIINIHQKIEKKNQISRKTRTKEALDDAGQEEGGEETFNNPLQKGNSFCLLTAQGVGAGSACEDNDAKNTYRVLRKTIL